MSSRWKAGQKSPNPRGRPKGRPDRRTKWRDTLRDEVPALLTKLVKLARGGDLEAMKLILSRVAPPLRPTSEPVDLPALADAQGIAAQSRVIRAAVAAGLLSPTDASVLVSLLASAADIERNNEDDDAVDATPVRITRRVVDAS